MSSRTIQLRNKSNLLLYFSVLYWPENSNIWSTFLNFPEIRSYNKLCYFVAISFVTPTKELKGWGLEDMKWKKIWNNFPSAEDILASSFLKTGVTRLRLIVSKDFKRFQKDKKLLGANIGLTARKNHSHHLWLSRLLKFTITLLSFPITLFIIFYFLLVHYLFTNTANSYRP